MYLLKSSIIWGLLTACSAFTLPVISQAAPSTAPVVLPSLTVMSEPELRATVEILPFQENAVQRQALQQRLMKIERDIQAYSVDADFAGSIEVLPAAPAPDLDSLSPFLREYVLAIARGLQSSDPRNGLYVILQQFGIKRNATNVQISGQQFNLGQLELDLNPSIVSR